MKLQNIINSCLVVIILSLITSIIYASFNIKNFDKNILNESDQSIHLMIKNDAFRYFSHGNEIKDQLKENTNYFETGRNNFTKYLFPRIIALYYLIFDYDLFENSENKVVKIGVHKNFLVLQILLYYLSVLFLYFQLRHKIDHKCLFFSLFFLCLEPTIFQYHGSFWSESIFFSLQILIMALILNNNLSNIRFFVLGIILSLLALQRTNGFYYLIPIILYFCFYKDLRFLKKIFFLLLGFSIFISFVGYHNYKKSGEFLIIPLETKSVLHAYLIPNILSAEDKEFEKEQFFKMIEKENITVDSNELENINYARYSFIFCENANKEKGNLGYLKICEYFHDRSKKLIYSHPIEFLKYVAKRSLSFSLLNPFHIYSDHKFLSGEKYYESDLRKKFLPYRIIYSLLIYFICFLGLIELYKRKDYKLMIYLLISSIYFFGILSWHGNNRYFTPVLIYMSLFFGYGFSNFLNTFYKKIDNNKKQ
tara:strand:- start:2469 stop:3905 length:1437 start_codon:yes stop_codon:yes gene_type:complete